MKQYEVTFIVDPVLSGDEIKATAKSYEDMLGKNGGTIVHHEEMGLRELAYPIKKRNSGQYYSIEFQLEKGNFVDTLELEMRRDDRVLRFLTVRLDKYGIKYNEDKRKGLIAKAVRPVRKEDRNDRRNDRRGNRKSAPRKQEAPKKEAPKKEAPKAAAPVKEEE